MFQINYDLNKIHFSIDNCFHFCISALFSVLFGFWIAWAIGILWEVGDGFKPWDWQAPPNTGWLKRKLLYSDKFSLQDVFVWDLGGALFGVILGGWVL